METVAEKILIVDDDPEFRMELKDALQGYDVLEASSSQEALSIIRRPHELGIVILDVMMPGLTGIDALREIKKTDPGLAIIMLTGHSSKDVVIESLQAHADDFLEKPVDIAAMKRAIDKIWDRRRSRDGSGVLGLDDKIEKTKRFVERNCFKKVTLSDAAESVCLSPKYLSRIFKESAGVGFSSYRLKIKIDKSKELLSASAYNVNQISEKLGYENTESFCRQFRKLTGYAPSAYRKKMASQNGHAKASKSRRNKRKKS